MVSSLTWTSAARIAAREMRSSRAKFLFVLISVAIGVAALTGVRGFSAAFRTTLLLRARSIMAADLSARTFRQPTPAEQQAMDDLRSTGVQTTTVTEMLSMASSTKSQDPVLVSLKAVDPAFYPFYGQVELAPAMPLSAALDGDSVAVGEDLLLRLNLHAGDQLKLGRETFRISSSVVNEPDRLSGGFTAGPRVLISRASLESSGLLAPGSRATERFLFKLPPPASGRPASDTAVADLKSRLEKLLPEAQIADYRESNPAVTDGLDHATGILSLMSLVALVLGAVGVAMAMRAHLQQRLDTIAIMKSLGARSSQVMKIYLLQTLLLGLLGGALGVLGGVAVQLAFPYVLGKLVTIPVEFHIQLRPILIGLSAGVVTTVLFTLPPLLDIRGIRPILILRRATESDGPDESTPMWRQILRRIPWVLLALIVTVASIVLERRRWPGHPLELTLEAICLLGAAAFGPWLLMKTRKNPAQVVSFVLILGGLGAIATTLSDSGQIGRVFSVGLVLVLLVLLAASAAVLALLKFFLNHTRLHLPSPLRHGLANLYRPGNPSAALLAALGMGIMQIMTVFLMQQGIVSELHISSAQNLPNIYLIDIGRDEIDGLRRLLKSQSSVTTAPEFLPVVNSRIDAIDGTPSDRLTIKNFPRRRLHSISVTWFDSVPAGTKVVDGAWWKANETRPQVAVSEGTAKRLGVKVGSVISFGEQDSDIDAKVVALYHSDGQHAASRAEFVLPSAVLANQPAIWYGAVHAVPSQVAQLQRTLYLAYPTITVINVAQALETVRAVVIQITYVIQFLAAFSIFAGIVILASSIAGTRYRRIREVVVLKTLGGTRPRIATIFSIEFAVLGLVAGIVGIVFANAVAQTLLHQMRVAYNTHWVMNLVALLTAALLTVLTGWLASHRVLGQKPLEVLREE
jgi:putative ABC transport system permease protein